MGDIWKLFGPQCDRRLNTMTFNLQDDLVNDLERFGTILVISASPYKHFDFVVSQDYMCDSNCLETIAKDNLTALDSNLKS